MQIVQHAMRIVKFVIPVVKLAKNDVPFSDLSMLDSILCEFLFCVNLRLSEIFFGANPKNLLNLV